MQISINSLSTIFLSGRSSFVVWNHIHLKLRTPNSCIVEKIAMMMLKTRSYRSGFLSVKNAYSKKGIRVWYSSSPLSTDSSKTTDSKEKQTNPVSENEAISSNTSRKNLPAFTNSTIATSISHVRNVGFGTNATEEITTNIDSTAKNLEDDGYGLNRKTDSLWWVRHFQQPPDPGTLILVRHGISIYTLLLR